MATIFNEYTENETVKKKKKKQQQLFRIDFF